MPGTEETHILPPCQSCPFSQAGFCGSIRDALLDRRPNAAGRLVLSYHFAREKRVILDARAAQGDVHVLCIGWACQFVRLADGRRQILSVLLPGDLFPAASLFGGDARHAVQSLTGVAYARLCGATLKARLLADPRVLESYARHCVAEIGFKDEMLIDLGRRSAEERIAHLILRMVDRIAARNVIRDDRYPWPLRQQDVADATGLTPVHVSRIVAELRRAGIVDVARSSLTILNRPALERIGRPL